MAILNLISEDTGLSAKYLEKLVGKAPYSYRHYTIPKKNGGTREIYHPTPELKLIQHWIARKVFSAFPIHECVYSYRSGVNVAHHASRHKKSNYLLRLDIKDFFPSITAKDITRFLTENLDAVPADINVNDIKTITKLVCRVTEDVKSTLRLTIGAPSSPIISNVLLFNFDELMYRHCADQNVIYTRYADDLYFSTCEPNTLSDVEKFVRSSLKELKSPALKVNSAKTVFTSRKRRRVVTGIVLTSDKKISIGRDAKRHIRTEIFLYLKGQLEVVKIATLRGKLNYYRSVDPEFITSLSRKFGEINIYALMKGLEINVALRNLSSI